MVIKNAGRSSTEHNRGQIIALSEGLRSAIPIMSLIKELRDEKIVLSKEVSKFKCRVFEDNIGAKTVATMPRYRPRTKHINIKYWHFIEHVKRVDWHPVSQVKGPAC